MSGTGFLHINFGKTGQGRLNAYTMDSGNNAEGRQATAGSGGGAVLLMIIRGGTRGSILPKGPPSGPVFDDPVQQRFLKADVVTGLLALDPFVP
jgi:hypothetical protein